MKTADLIPFILLELADCDKYGFELTKNIETKSNGKIVIKQPTLYTLLKKLEKSKFISSYWQDSDIGGKRHYYKLTENGKLQVSTLPSYDFLLKSALDEEVDEFEMTSLNSNIVIKDNVEEKPISIMDELLNQNIKTPLETVLPTEEVFAEKTIDVSTEIEQNLSNIDMLKSENVT
ncbi:MAG: PadR family transcriptional regulator, partial [Clostridia bacterium]|nr:PadR family transcriptional regulator [Clostridia bacterium]